VHGLCLGHGVHTPNEVERPHHCPYPKCENVSIFWIHQRIKDAPDRTRFRCLGCKRTFSYAQFHFEFRNKRRGLNHLIFAHFTAGLSNRQIASAISSSECLVRNRIEKMAKQAIIMHDLLSSKSPIHEPIAFDGLENFARSQYEPNNIQQAIGSRSLFIYDFNFAPLNRKGRMSQRPKERNAHFATTLGQFPKNAVELASKKLLERLLKRSALAKKPLELLSDEHFHYRRAVERINRNSHQKIEHATVSSKTPRTFKNVLFPVNHTDLLTRQHIKAFARETISFSKNHSAMVQKYALFAAWKNYMRPQFTKPQKQNPTANTHTPAQRAGITTRILRFGDLFSIRIPVPKHHSPNSDWTLFLKNQTPFPRKLPSTPSTPHLSAYN